MPRAHLSRPILDAAGNVRTGASVRVLQPGTATPVAATLYAADQGAAQVTNPFIATNGVVNFYLDAPTRVRIGVTVGQEGEVFFEDVDVLVPASSTNQSNSVVLTDSATNATLTDADSAVFFDGTNLTATLPTAVGRRGRQFTIKDLNISPLTVVSNGGLIDADTSRTLAQYDSLTIISNGTNWSVV